MKDNSPSATALKVAQRRAAHQILDTPIIFDDPLILRILGMQDAPAPSPDPNDLERTPLLRGLRAFLAARSRYTEDELISAVGRGVGQYVVLGAGLDTFAYRNPYPEGVLSVFEVDFPATQKWKRERLEAAGIPIPPSLTFVPVDFEAGTMEEGLRAAGLDTAAPAFFSWLGVTHYLTKEAIFATLRFVASMPAMSAVVFDYTISPTLLGATARAAFDFISARVAAAGEPFRNFFDPSELKDDLMNMDFSHVEDMGPDRINERYFTGRTDGLKIGGFARIMNARV